ncbi:MAG: molybdopterin converting factor subunit 1 [Alphaproteobacteria bacterium]
MKVLYFAWLRERVGLGEEEVSPPGDVATVGALMRWLAESGEGHAAAFADPAVVRAAVNQEHATPDTPVRADDEVAFFPPVTGG